MPSMKTVDVTMAKRAISFRFIPKHVPNVISYAYLRDHSQISANSAISLVVDNVIFVLIGQFFLTIMNFEHGFFGRGNPAVSVPRNGVRTWLGSLAQGMHVQKK